MGFSSQWSNIIGYISVYLDTSWQKLCLHVQKMVITFPPSSALGWCFLRPTIHIAAALQRLLFVKPHLLLSNPIKSLNNLKIPLEMNLPLIIQFTWKYVALKKL